MDYFTSVPVSTAVSMNTVRKTRAIIRHYGIAVPFAAAFFSTCLVVGLAIMQAHRYVGFVRGETLTVSEDIEVDGERKLRLSKAIRRAITSTFVFKTPLVTSIHNNYWTTLPIFTRGRHVVGSEQPSPLQHRHDRSSNIRVMYVTYASRIVAGCNVDAYYS